MSRALPRSGWLSAIPVVATELGIGGQVEQRSGAEWWQLRPVIGEGMRGTTAVGQMA